MKDNLSLIVDAVNVRLSEATTTHTAIAALEEVRQLVFTGVPPGKRSDTLVALLLNCSERMAACIDLLKQKQRAQRWIREFFFTSPEVIAQVGLEFSEAFENVYAKAAFLEIFISNKRAAVHPANLITAVEKLQLPLSVASACMIQIMRRDVFRTDESVAYVERLIERLRGIDPALAETHERGLNSILPPRHPATSAEVSTTSLRNLKLGDW